MPTKVSEADVPVIVFSGSDTFIIPNSRLAILLVFPDYSSTRISSISNHKKGSNAQCAGSEEVLGRFWRVFLILLVTDRPLVSS